MKKRKYIATLVTIGICIVMYAVSVLLNEVFTNLNQTEIGILIGAYYKPFIIAGEWWRLLTAGFIHLTITHLLVNMYSLYSIGKMLEPLLGTLKFVILLLASIVGGCLFVFATGGNDITVGISGGIYGLIGCYIYFLIIHGLYKIPRIRNSLISLVLINLYINFMPGISVAGHIGGFVTGFLISTFYLAERKNMRQKVISVVSCVVFTCALLVFSHSNAYILSEERYIGTDLHILTIYTEFGLDGHAENVALELNEIYEISGLESAY